MTRRARMPISVELHWSCARSPHASEKGPMDVFIEKSRAFSKAGTHRKINSSDSCTFEILPCFRDFRLAAFPTFSAAVSKFRVCEPRLSPAARLSQSCSIMTIRGSSSTTNTRFMQFQPSFLVQSSTHFLVSINRSFSLQRAAKRRLVNCFAFARLDGGLMQAWWKGKDPDCTVVLPSS